LLDDLRKSKLLLKFSYDEVRDFITELKHEQPTASKVDFLVQLEELMHLILKPLEIDCRLNIGNLAQIKSFEFDMQMEI
jgi:hypothetical protein